jgi:hypothetical protein
MRLSQNAVFALCATGCLAALLAGASSKAADAPLGTPLRIIKGTGTGLLWPSGIAVDPAGNIYVGNDGSLAGKLDTLTVYAQSASGDAAPIRTISGALARPGGIALDAAGALYVASSGTSGGGASEGPGAILVFDKAAHGDVVPARTITSGVLKPKGLAFGPHGDLYVANYGAMVNAPNSITVYGPGAKGQSAPVRTISGPHTTLDTPLGLTVDSHGFVYVVNSGRVNLGIDSIIIFAPNANGDAKPARIITGSQTALDTPQSIAVDGDGYAYVSNLVDSNVTVYAPGASGNALPVRTIGGSDAGLGAYVEGVVLDAHGQLYVVSRSQRVTEDPSWVSVFATR